MKIEYWRAMRVFVASLDAKDGEFSSSMKINTFAAEPLLPPEAGASARPSPPAAPGRLERAPRMAEMEGASGWGPHYAAMCAVVRLSAGVMMTRQGDTGTAGAKIPLYGKQVSVVEVLLSFPLG